MRILGIDPGLRTTGFGVIEKHGSKVAYIGSGTVQTDAALPLPQRLKTIFDGVTQIIQTYQPACAAVEIVFVNVNPQSTLLLGQARGAAVCGLVHANLTVAEFTALQVKQAVVGHGKAQKEQVQHMVQRLLQLPGLPGTDAADALGVAICHANSMDALALMSKSGAGLKGMKMRNGRLIAG